MTLRNIHEVKSMLDRQYENISWIQSSGLSYNELSKRVLEIEKEYENRTKAVIKAKTFEFILDNGQIAVDNDDIFNEKLNAVRIMSGQRWKWNSECISKHEELKTKHALINEADISGAFGAIGDYGHTSINIERLFKIGFGGVLEHLNSAKSAKEQLSCDEADFYESCEIYIKAIQRFLLRLADAVEETNSENALCLRNISASRPQNIYEALQLLISHFYLHEYIAGTRVRTLGRLDKILYPFYTNDLRNGTFTKEEIHEIIKYFLNKLWSMKVPYDLPFQLSGLDKDGSCVTNELSYMIVKAYMELDIYSPKIHIRVSDKTPESFIKLVLSSIREGKSSFVFGNDNVVVKALENVGIFKEDALDYTFIGCYEPAVYAHEMGCTGNGYINGAKAVEFAFTGGIDHASGKEISVKTGEIKTYDDFVCAVKAHIRYMAETAMDYISTIEKHYMEIFPDPLMSSLLEECVDSGRDAYSGSVRYNNSSLYIRYIATVTDSIAAVKKLVFDDKICTFDTLSEALKNNWKGFEKLRVQALRLKEKYGNNNKYTDEIMVDISNYFSSLVTGHPNGRGGVFKASCFSIDNYVKDGKNTMATPDGRCAGDVLSKNLCPSTGMDRNGITSLISSVSKIDLSAYPNGSVLDVILHPSAVSGDDGLDAFYGILKTYFAKGGMALHGNVFNAETLKNAQKNPEMYKNLQVRVCGWNAYFVNLSKAEQDDFIRKCENV